MEKVTKEKIAYMTEAELTQFLRDCEERAAKLQAHADELERFVKERNAQ
jgi:hypothetical protein